MNIMLDAAAVLVLVAAVSINAKRGFVRCVLLFLSLVLAFGMALSVSAAVAEPVYDNLLSKKVTSLVKENLPETDMVAFVNDEVVYKLSGHSVDSEKLREAILREGLIAENITSLIEEETGKQIEKSKVEEALGINGLIYENDNFSEGTKDMLASAAEMSEESLSSLVRILAENDREKTAEQVSLKVIRPLGVRVTRLVVGLILFIIFSALLRFVVNRFDLLDKIPVAGKLNTILGGVAGALIGVVVLYMLISALSLVSALLPDAAFASPEVIDKTVVVRLFYNLRL